MKAIIIDDEEYVRETLKEMISFHCPEITSLCTADGVKSGLETIAKENPDIIFLDVRMEDGTGFDLLRSIPDITFHIVFITAHEEYAIKALKFSALDYLLKPVDIDELSETVKKAKDLIQKDQVRLKIESFLINQESKDKRIVLKTAEAIHIVNVQDIIRCESDSNYTNFYISGDKKLIVSKTLKEYEELLSDYGFVRSHQSHLVNLNFVEKFDKRDGGMLVLKDNQQVPVSTRKREELLQMFDYM